VSGRMLRQLEGVVHDAGEAAQERTLPNSTIHLSSDHNRASRRSSAKKMIYGATVLHEYSRENSTSSPVNLPIHNLNYAPSLCALWLLSTCIPSQPITTANLHSPFGVDTRSHTPITITPEGYYSSTSHGGKDE
jgi:hypothetical protein